MPSAYFTASSPISNTSNSDYSPQTSSITTPQARLASNGNRPIKIYQVRMNVSGYSASRTVRIEMTGGYDGSTGNFTVASGSSAANTGFKSINVGIATTPASSTVSLYVSGRSYIGTDTSSGNNFLASNGSVLYSNRGLWGQYSYVQVPVAPNTPSVSANVSESSITVSWSTVSDWGDSSSDLGYLVELLQNGSFYTSQEVSGSGTSSYKFQNLPTGSNYSARVYAYNELKSFSNSPKSTVSGTSSSVFLASPTVYYDVSYDSNGGSISPQTTTHEAGSLIYLPSPGTKSGYTFAGWDNLYSVGQPYTVNSDKLFTAYWSLNTYTVSFDGNGGTTPSDITVNQGSSLTLPSSTRSGYSFNGWYTSSSGGSFVGTYQNEYYPSSDINLFAQWTPNAPGFTDETVTSSIYVNQDFSTAVDRSVSATNATSYSISYAPAGGGMNPSWLSINSSGQLSGSTGIAGVYTFTITATGLGGSVTSNIKTVSVGYPGRRFDSGQNPIQLTQMSRYNGSSWVPVTIAKRWDGSSWVGISN